MSARVVITAGGTTESIDDVRTMGVFEVDGSIMDGIKRLSRYDISNISKGGFSVEIARALRALDPEVDITIIGRQELVSELKKNPDVAWLHLVPFRSFADLDQAIQQEIARDPIDAFLMAAAVSDYSPVAVDGKISSDDEELVIRLRKNPKLLNALRDQLGPDCVLVGFKLLSHVPHEKLIEVARSQVVRCRCDFTIANDAALINWATEWHPISMVSAEKEEWHVDGLRTESAKAVAAEVVKNLQIHRHGTTP